MLSSIHPLGERARGNNWGVTVTSFTLGSMLTAGVVGLALGSLGSLIFASRDRTMLLLGTASAALAAGVLDAARVRPPGPERQVNESWIGHFRGWVYGGAFGVELGAGVATYVVTWGVYATFATELLAGSWAGGLVVGAVFGVGRSLALWLAGTIDRPSRLTSFHKKMADLGPSVRRAATAGLGALGALAVLGAML